MSKQVLLMPCPPNTRGAYSVSSVTGSMPFTLADTDLLYAFQWTTANHYAVLDYLSISVVVSATITTAVVTGVELVPVRDFFNAYTGGRSLLGVAPADHGMKLKSNFPTSLATDIRVANAIPLDLPLVPGTEDGVGISNAIFGTGTVVGTTILADQPLFDRAANSYPFIMDTFEGFVVRMALNGPATGNLRFGIDHRWLETTKAVY